MNGDLGAILGGLSAAVILVDGTRRIVFANASAAERFGQSLTGQNIVRAVRHPDCLSALDKVLAGADRATAVIVLETPVRVTLQVTVTALGETHPSGMRAALSFEDISHVLEAEQMRSDFVANVSHELRSPLTSLTGFIETLKGPARDDEDAQVRFLDLMEDEAQRMNRLLRDLLSLSKVEANERVRPMDPIDMAVLLRRVTDQLAPLIEREGKSVKLEEPPDNAIVAGEEDELIQVFQNLLENALKYSAPESEVRVTFNILHTAGGFSGPAVSICVHDRGEGINPLHIPRLTERFYRVDTGRSRDKGGTGLGLAIVKHIVNRHRGRLNIRSRPGEGSTFCVLLPQHKAA